MLPTTERKLAKILGLRNEAGIVMIRTVEDSKGPEGNEKYFISYRMQLTNGSVIDLGPAAEVISFRKVQAAFAESCRHVIPSKESKNWDETAQLIFDFFEECGYLHGISAEKEEEDLSEEVERSFKPLEEAGNEFVANDTVTGGLPT